ncbi:hypothetical protein GCE86_27675 [Micromonospora terminaliae]|uniref:Uncharacterized protein n=1 Tax=Micromonospora terminaliae TaxID=1914461 RepID=A0ABX6E8H2_9ACTN|nr:hypothetical protein [Micromonospora terminaliae]QGL50467.1 hypothetical protein GCE86_27675 [Micromonospora terminaliae]
MEQPPEEQDQRKTAFLVEAALICETLTGLQALVSSEEPSLTAGLLLLVLWLATSCNSRKL